MNIKITVVLLTIILIYLLNFETSQDDQRSVGSIKIGAIQTEQQPLTEAVPDDALNLLIAGLEPLKIEGFALTPVVSIPGATYSTSSPELQGQLTATEDIGPKFRKGGFRNERVDQSVVVNYLQEGQFEQAKSEANKSLVSSFNAGGQATNVANTGFLNIPADPHGAAGPDHLVNVFNTSIEFYNKNGTGGVSGSLQGFFAPLGPVNLTFDPKVLYDQIDGRWVVVTLQRTDTANGDPSNTSNVFVAVSATDDPNGAWFMTSINTVVNISGINRWFDYPGLAIDDEVIYLTGNMFGFGAAGTGAGSRLWIIDKFDFYAGNAPVVLGPIDPYAGAGVNTTTQPAHVYGVSPAGFGTYLVSYSRLSNGVQEFWQSVRVDNPLGAINFDQQFISVGDIEPNGAGLPVAPQAGLSTDTNSSFTVATNDPRALDAVWRDNKLYGTATIESQTELGETSASWVSFDANGTSAIALDQFGIVDGEDLAVGTFTFFPSIAVNLDGGIALGYSASATTLNPGSYYTFKSTTDTDMRDSRVLRAGTDFYYRTFGAGNNRWGDYSAMVVDPNDECFWVYNKHAVTRGIPTGGNDEDGLYLSAYGEVCNDEPNGVNDSTSVQENGTITSVNGGFTSVLNNDSDGDVDDTLIAVLQSSPLDASAFSLNADGTFSYAHNGDEAPTDSFTYNACDDGTPAKCNSATVSISISPVDDLPTAVNDGVITVVEDSTNNSIAVLSNDTDPDGGPLNITAVGTPGNGSASANGSNIDYSPTADYCGADSFIYTINGGSQATVSIDVTCVDDLPTAVNDGVITVLEDSTNNSIAVLSNDDNADGGPLNITAVGTPGNGSASANGNNIDYSPTADYCGADSFIYTINGGSQATVSIDVTCVDDLPTAVNDGVITVVEDSTNNSIAVLSNDDNADGGPLNITAVGTPGNGSASANGSNIDYSPTADYCGADSFIYTINGGSQATVSIDVTCVDDLPTAVNDGVITVLEDSTNNSIAVLSNDDNADGGPLNITAVGTPGNGSASANGSNIDYSPTADYCGADSFTYTINGGSQATVSIDVTCVNDEPSMVVNAAVYVNLSDIANPPTQIVACQFDFGPDNEDLSQSVADMNVSVANDNNNVLNAIDVDNNGALSYTFTGNSGVAEVTVSLQDDGGTDDGGDDTSTDYTFSVSVQDYVFRDDFESDVCQ